jgi:hypothetical protein
MPLKVCCPTISCSRKTIVVSILAIAALRYDKPQVITFFINAPKKPRELLSRGPAKYFMPFKSGLVIR